MSAKDPKSPQKSRAFDVIHLSPLRPTLTTINANNSNSKKRKRKKSINNLPFDIQEILPYQPDPKCKSSKFNRDYYPHHSHNKREKKFITNHIAFFSKLPIWKRHYTLTYVTTHQYAAFRQLHSFIPSFFHLPPCTSSSTSPTKTIIIRICEFFLFCHERQKIWYNRHILNLPKSKWTQDELLSTKHFTNLYRELDAGTVYFQQSIDCLRREEEEEEEEEEEDDDDDDDDRRMKKKKKKLTMYHYEKQVIWAAICYRLLNRVETFHEIGGIPKVQEYKSFSKKVHSLRTRSTTPTTSGGNSIFTGAHQNIGFIRYFQTLQSLQTQNCSLLNDITIRIKDALEMNDVEECTKVIESVMNIGKFFAWQITCDLMECHLFGFGCCKKNNDGRSNSGGEIELDWVQLGPGAEKGLAYIFGEETTKKKNNNNNIKLCQELTCIQSYIFESIGVKFIPPPFIYNRYFHLNLKDIEHSLCEFQKYVNCIEKEETANAMRAYRPKESMKR